MIEERKRKNRIKCKMNELRKWEDLKWFDQIKLRSRKKK